jgi:Phage integrase family
VTTCETATDIGGKITSGSRRCRSLAGQSCLPAASCGKSNLIDYVAAGPEALVFTSLTGNPLYRGTFWPSVWKPAVRAAGLDGLRIHDLRHTYVSLMVAAGANPKEVSTWAGHSSVSFTLDRYGHLYDEHGDDGDACGPAISRQTGGGVGVHTSSTKTAVVAMLVMPYLFHA